MDCKLNASKSDTCAIQFYSYNARVTVDGNFGQFEFFSTLWHGTAAAEMLGFIGVTISYNS